MGGWIRLGRWAPLLACLAGCQLFGSADGPALDHRLRLDGDSDLLVTASFRRESETFIRYTPVRFQVEGDSDAPELEGLELILFDDLNGDGQLQDRELCGRVQAQLGVSTRRLEIASLRANQPRLRAMWLLTVQTTERPRSSIWPQVPVEVP